MIQLLIATEEIFKVHTVSAALREALSRELCPLVCVIGCDGTRSYRHRLSTQNLFDLSLNSKFIDLGHEFNRGWTLKQGARTHSRDKTFVDRLSNQLSVPHKSFIPCSVGMLQFMSMKSEGRRPKTQVLINQQLMYKGTLLLVHI